MFFRPAAICIRVYRRGRNEIICHAGCHVECDSWYIMLVRWIRQWWFDVKHQLVERPFLLLLVSWIASLSLCGSCGLLGLTRLALVICWSLVLLSCTCHRCHQALRSGIWREKSKTLSQKAFNSLSSLQLLPVFGPHSFFPQSLFSPYTISIRYEMQSQTLRSAPALLSNAWPIYHSS